MENWININSEYISPLALLLCGIGVVAISYLLARLKERLPHGNEIIYP